MKEKRCLVLIASICFLCVAGMVLALIFGQKTEVRFAPPPFESAALAGVPSDAPASYGELDAKAYRFSVCGQPSVENGAVQMYLTNTASNEVYLKIRIMDAAGSILGESGLLRPGEYVKSVPLTLTPAKDDDTTLLIMAYAPQTYYSMGNVRLHTRLIIDGD